MKEALTIGTMANCIIASSLHRNIASSQHRFNHTRAPNRFWGSDDGTLFIIVKEAKAVKKNITPTAQRLTRRSLY